MLAVVEPKTGGIEATSRREVAISTFPRVTDLDGDESVDIPRIYGGGRGVSLSSA